MKSARTSLSRPTILTIAGITCLQVFDCLEPFLEPAGGHGLRAGYPVVSLLKILCYLAIAATFKRSASILESRRLSSALCLGPRSARASSHSALSMRPTSRHGHTPPR